jgi:hypothetical protein
MFNLKLNILKLVYENTIRDMHTPERMDFIKALIRPFKLMYSEYTVAKDKYLYQCTFNGSVIALETALNDRFDNVNRGITIEDATYDKVYLYLQSESQLPLYMYRRWNATTFASASAGVFCVRGGVVYSANASVVGTDVPGVSVKWDVEATKQTPYLRRQSNYNGAVKFTIKVPSSVTFNMNELKGLVNYYKIAGPGYQVLVV